MDDVSFFSLIAISFFFIAFLGAIWGSLILVLIFALMGIASTIFTFLLFVGEQTNQKELKTI